MTKPLFSMKIALLAANGFTQNDLVTAQKALIEQGANVRIVSSENGLVCGWEDNGWGHHFAVDAALSTALGADYSAIVIPGGQRSMDKLNLTAHTKRFISSFMDAGKPVCVMGNALHIMVLTDNVRGRSVSGPEDMEDMITQAGGDWVGKASHIDHNMITGRSDDTHRAALVSEIVAHITASQTAAQAA